MKKYQKTAFSIFELSVVIAIIAIVVAAITTSSRIIARSRLASAQSLTASSPIHDLDNVYMWLETTSTKSFNNESPDDSATLTTTGIGTWYDINPHPLTRKNATGYTVDGPKYYLKCINRLPCLRFDGVDDYMTFTATDFGNHDYSIFIIEQRRQDASNQIIGTSTSPITNTSIEIGYDSSNKIVLSQGGQSANAIKFTPSPAFGSYDDPIPRLHSFIVSTLRSGSSQGNHYLNGTSTASSATTIGGGFANVTSYTTPTIGANHNGTSFGYYGGDIGEIIIFTRALSKLERRSVEDYLLKKWHIPRAN